MKTPEILPRAGKVLMKYKYLLIVITAGLLILMWTNGADPPAPQADPPVAEALFSLEETERKLAETLSAIAGAGKVEVMLTLKTGMEVVLATDTDTRTHREAENGQVSDDEQQSKTVLTSGTGSGEPVVTKHIYPQFQGALIVCEGAGSAQVQMAVLEAVSALTGLRSDNISVVQRRFK